MSLSDETQQVLRNHGKIQNNEILVKEGDLLVAVNVVNNERRLVEHDDTILKILEGMASINERRILKG